MSDPFQQYILDRVVVDQAGCWIWRLSLDRDGYGYGCFQKRKWRAHRLSYEAFVGAISDGLQIDHLCRVRNCVNPSHLEQVTCAENVRRGEAGSQAKSACKRGHDFSVHGVIRKSGAKQCRECDRIRSRNWYAANTELARASYARRRDKILTYKAKHYREKKETA